MLDFIFGLFLAGMLLRGWLRGFVREALDLVGLVVGLWVAFKLSAPFGDFLTKSFGVTPEIARIGGGIALFVLFGIAMSVAAHFLSKLMSLPGLNLINRVGGAAVASAWAALIVLVVVNVARVLPLPDDWDVALEESSVVQGIAGPDAIPQRLFESLAGDNLLTALASIQDLFGTSRAVPEPDQPLVIPPAGSDEIRQVRSEAETIVDEINDHRIGLGLRALLAVDLMTTAAEQAGVGMYTSGRLTSLEDCRETLDSAGVRLAVCGQTSALAGTGLGALDGIKDSTHGSDQLATPDYDRIGVSVVDGPTGRLVVVYLGG